MGPPICRGYPILPRTPLMHWECWVLLIALVPLIVMGPTHCVGSPRIRTEPKVLALSALNPSSLFFVLTVIAKSFRTFLIDPE